MLDHYDFSNATRNPYVIVNKEKVTLELKPSTLQYFKKLAEGVGKTLPELIAAYLDEWANQKRSTIPY